MPETEPQTHVVVSGPPIARCAAGHDTECKKDGVDRNGKSYYQVPDDCPKCGHMIVATWRRATKAVALA